MTYPSGRFPIWLLITFFLFIVLDRAFSGPSQHWLFIAILVITTIGLAIFSRLFKGGRQGDQTKPSASQDD